MKNKYSHFILALCCFGLYGALAWAQNLPVRMAIGTVQSEIASSILLNSDLVEMSAKALGFEMMGYSLDTIALRLKKFEVVPTYRITRVLQGLAATYRDNLTDSDSTVVMKAIEKQKSSCDQSEPCTFTITMKTANWSKPVPDFSRPARQSDVDFYDQSFARTYFLNNISDAIQTLKTEGQVQILGQTFNRDTNLGPITNSEIQEFEKLISNIYAEVLKKRYFTTTPIGIFWNQDVRSEFRKFPWADLTIRSAHFPQTYQELTEIIKNGLNHFYLSQKREEIYWGLLSEFNNDLIKMTQYLFNQVQFIPNLIFYTQSGQADSQLQSLLQFQQVTLDEIQKTIDSRGLLVAQQLVKQTVLVLIDDKERLK